MNKAIRTTLFSIFILLITISCSEAQVSIGAPSPAASAQLDVSSTNKGFLLPRMTQAQRASITNAVPGLMIWCNNCVAPAGELQVFNGVSWTNLIGGTTPSGTVILYNKAWAVKNLDVDRYRNGDPIPQVTTDYLIWAGLTTGAYCYYNNDSATYAATYGKLYNWYALNDPRGLAPEGWHIPSYAEWTTLFTCLGGESIAGGAMKETGTSNWLPPNTGATNSSGFTGLPGGTRDQYGVSFGGIGAAGWWWSITENDANTAWSLILLNNFGNLAFTTRDKNFGKSVRCVRD